MATFYDTHAHLDYPDFATELPEVVSRAGAAGIAKIISIGTDLESSRRAIKLCRTIFGCLCSRRMASVQRARSSGRYCGRACANWPGTRAWSRWARRASIIIGFPVKQSGADRDADARYKAKQAALFKQHLEVAAETGLNCVIHQRDALEDTLSQLTPFADRVRGVFHCFANDAATMRAF